jgi:ribA/ribD-fused uncharacterized protein
MNEIHFYNPRGRFGFLANFSRHPIIVGGEVWKTVEHYFQSQKFVHRPEVLRAVKSASTPSAAKKMAKDNKRFRRRDWLKIRERVMRTALNAKFEQHPDLAQKLLATKNCPLVEIAPDDAFWGVGSDGNGKNKAGKLLMRIRGHLASRSDGGMTSR